MQSMKTMLLCLGGAGLLACDGAPADTSATEAAAKQLLATGTTATANETAKPARRLVTLRSPTAKRSGEKSKKPAKVDQRVAGTTNSASASKGYSSSKYAGLQADSDDPRFSGFREMAEEFPWRVDDSGTWNGSGVEDPEPLKDVSHEEMLKRANSAGFTTERGNALVSVGRRKMPGALDALAAALEPSGHQMTRMLAISGLIEHGGEQARELLWRAMTEDPDGGLRGSALWGLALYGHDESLRAIRAGLEDEDPGTRGMAIMATTSLRDEEVTMAILERAINSDELGEYQEGAYVLSNIKTQAARRMLSDAYDRATDKGKRITLRSYLKMALRNRVPTVD